MSNGKNKQQQDKPTKSEDAQESYYYSRSNQNETIKCMHSNDKKLTSQQPAASGC